MSELLTMQDLANGHLDVVSFEKFINGSDSETVLTRLSAEYPTLQKALKELFENGGIAGRFKTLTELESSNLVDGDYALVTDDVVTKNGIYIKESSAWIRSKYDPALHAFSLSQGYVDTAIYKRIEATDKHSFLDAYIDKNGDVYKYTDGMGEVHLVGMPYSTSVQQSFRDIKGSEWFDRLSFDDGKTLVIIADDTGAVMGYFDEGANLHVAGNIYHAGEDDKADKSLAYSYAKDAALLKHDVIKKLSFIAQKETIEGYVIQKRMPAAIKTPTGLMGFYHNRIAPYNGDTEGSEFYKFIASIDDEYNVIITSDEFWLKPDADEGIIKHPMLAYKNNGDILLMFERRESMSEYYTQYQCTSSDDGVSFAEPRQVVFNNTTPNGLLSTALGTTGTIVNIDGRLVVPMYGGSYCFCAYSDDDGETWWYGSLVGGGFMGHEPSITIDFNNNLLMDVRPTRPSGKFRRFKAISYDKGETWQAVSDDDYEVLNSAPNQGTVFTDNEIGLIIQTHSDKTVDKRENYTLSLSLDNGKTYPLRYRPFEENRYIGYTHIIKLETGLYAVIMEYGDLDYRTPSSTESSAVLIVSLKEMLKNVSNH